MNMTEATTVGWK